MSLLIMFYVNFFNKTLVIFLFRVAFLKFSFLAPSSCPSTVKSPFFSIKHMYAHIFHVFVCM